MIKHAIIYQLNTIRQLLEAPQPSQTRLLAATTHTRDLSEDAYRREEYTCDVCGKPIHAHDYDDRIIWTKNGNPICPNCYSNLKENRLINLSSLGYTKEYEIVTRLDFCINHLFDQTLSEDDIDAISDYLAEIEELLD